MTWMISLVLAKFHRGFLTFITFSNISSILRKHDQRATLYSNYTITENITKLKGSYVTSARLVSRYMRDVCEKLVS